ncbi:hypothetical protein Ahu01nite_057210 [Winogradskya humida]|uniref:Uncharacterized protein n=1 Tax=Winogradskya humida TaxID=113566 RepID=A0ABQ3ZVM1_9ACTN|nr:hypothetical protein Ahu01nite_057210 [Actinoplanes humidus]
MPPSDPAVVPHVVQPGCTRALGDGEEDPLVRSARSVWSVGITRRWQDADGSDLWVAPDETAANRSQPRPATAAGSAAIADEGSGAEAPPGPVLPARNPHQLLLARFNAANRIDWTAQSSC